MSTLMAAIFGSNTRRSARVTLFMYIMIAEVTVWQQWLSSAPDELIGVSWKGWIGLLLSTIATGFVTARAVMTQSWTPDKALEENTK